MNARRFVFIVLLTLIANGLVMVRVLGWGRMAAPMVMDEHLPLRDGDLVLRCSRGLVGDWFRMTSMDDRKFSHAGIFIQTENGPAVAHVSQDPPAGLKIEALDQFCSGRSSSLVGWVRTDLSEKQRKRIHVLVKQELAQGRLFDDRFSLDENQRQYCTEWVRGVFITATHDSTYIPVTNAAGFRYVAPDNLYMNHHSTLIHTFKP